MRAAANAHENPVPSVTALIGRQSESRDFMPAIESYFYARLCNRGVSPS
jgi:hypothetical protein